MFCTDCGNKISEKTVFCTECGHPTASKNNAVSSVDHVSTNLSEEQQKVYYSYLLLIERAKKAANVEMVKGIGWAVLGFIITFVTYAMASDGGTYFVFWGLVIYGAYVFLRGLYWRISPKSLLKKALEITSEDADSNKEKK